MRALVLAILLAAAPVGVERVVALVNSSPILQSDVELATIARLVPRQPDEDDASYRAAVIEALVTLELRWQELQGAGIAQRLVVDEASAFAAAAGRAGGEDALRNELAAAGLPEELLHDLLRRAATVQAYVEQRFLPFSRPTRQEVEHYYSTDLAEAMRARGAALPPFDEVRAQIEALVRQRKLNAEIDRWTAELESRGVVVRYSR